MMDFLKAVSTANGFELSAVWNSIVSSAVALCESGKLNAAIELLEDENYHTEATALAFYVANNGKVSIGGIN